MRTRATHTSSNPTMWSRVLGSVGVSAAVVGLAAVTLVTVPGGQARAAHPAGLTFTVAPTITVGPPPGRLFGWGGGAAYCLGDGSTANQPRPVEIMRDVAQVSTSGSLCGLALKLDGTVWTWGWGNYGDLGHGQMGGTDKVPTQITALSHVIAVSAGSLTGYALKSDGSVWAWGDDLENQLGDDKYVNRDVPVRVPGLPAAKAIAGGNAVAMIIAEDGSVWGWGDGIFGDGSPRGGPPFQMAYPTPVSAINASVDGFAITGGSIEDSGQNYGALGDNGTIGYGLGTAYDRVYGVSTAVQVASDAENGYALLSSGGIVGWGINTWGELGRSPAALPSSNHPVLISGVSNATAVAGDDGNAYALAQGRVYAWGDNTWGQIGDGTTHERNAPVLLPNLGGVTSIAAASGVAFAVLN